MTAPERRHSVGDTLATVVLGVLTALAAAASFVISPFFVMVTDACGPDNCHPVMLTLAYVVTWGGIVAAVVVGIVGVVRASRHGTSKWVWAAAALVTVVASFVIGALLAMAVMPS